eukprot:SAG31_NODE_2813_length_5048_cov_8.252576_1_plen_91_part_00
MTQVADEFLRAGETHFITVWASGYDVSAQGVTFDMRVPGARMSLVELLNQFGAVHIHCWLPVVGPSATVAFAKVLFVGEPSGPLELVEAV